MLVCNKSARTVNAATINDENAPDDFLKYHIYFNGVCPLITVTSWTSSVPKEASFKYRYNKGCPCIGNSPHVQEYSLTNSEGPEPGRGLVRYAKRLSHFIRPLEQHIRIVERSTHYVRKTDTRSDAIVLPDHEGAENSAPSIQSPEKVEIEINKHTDLLLLEVPRNMELVPESRPPNHKISFADDPPYSRPKDKDIPAIIPQYSLCRYDLPGWITKASVKQKLMNIEI